MTWRFPSTARSMFAVSASNVSANQVTRSVPMAMSDIVGVRRPRARRCQRACSRTKFASTVIGWRTSTARESALRVSAWPGSK